ncbi:MAG: GGDEF domain-containing protein, partial [Micromonosporaceae bacterium]|nr:GGDEF domain-containing protein [Micromonosporaceae bacterium]
MAVTTRQPLMFWAYLAGMLSLVAVHPMLPVLGQDLNYVVVTLGAVPPIVYGYWRVRSDYTLPWILILIAMASFSMASLVWFFGAHGPPDLRPLVEGSRALGTLGKIIILTTTVVIVIRRGRNDTGGILDTTIISMAVSGVLWDYLLLPSMRADGDGPLAMIGMFTSVFVLAGVLGTLVRLIHTAAQRLLSLWLMSASLGAALLSTIIGELQSVPMMGTRPPWTDMVLMCSFILMGSVGLERDSPLLVQEGPTPDDVLSRGRLVFLGVSVASIPVIGGGHQLIGGQVDGVLLAVGGLAIVALVMIRVGMLSAQRNRAQQALLYQATHDELTGLANRRAFVATAARELSCPDRPGQPLILFCDLDGFKAVNDRLGHAAGDQLLVEVGGRLRDGVREGDTVSRFGGDEFVILCWAEPGNEMSIVTRVAEAVYRPIEICGELVQVGISIGVTVAAAGGALPCGALSGGALPGGALPGGPVRDLVAEDLAEQAIKRADLAMYEAKRRHRA